MKRQKIDKSFVGKYVCYVKADGSFTWGRIVDQGFINNASGEQEVFIVEDQLTCRVAQNELELRALRGISHRIEAGKAGPTYLPGREPRRLPDYQQSNKLIQEGKKDAVVKVGKSNMVKVSTPEGQGLVPVLEEEMGLKRSDGLQMFQRVGCVKSRTTGQDINFGVRKFGYNTIVHKKNINLETDIVDPELPFFDGMDEAEMFQQAMAMKVHGTSIPKLLS